MIKNIINSLNNPQLFEPTICIDPEVLDFEDKQFIYLNVPESNQVHRYKGKIYDRIGDSDNDISKSHYMIDNIYLRKRKESSESEVCPFYTIEDMDEETFRIMRSHISIHNPEHPWLKMSNEEFLRKFFWGRDKQTNQEGYLLSAILLFGQEKTVLACCPYHRTDAIYRNMSYERFLHPRPEDPDIRYDDRDMICVNIIQSYLRLMNFVNRNLPDKFRLDEKGINRIDVRNFIFREVSANMLVHREYTHSYPAKFLIFRDRVIAENWTKPIQTGVVTLENWESHTKNPLITKVFREMKWVEELGSGRKNIQKYAPLYYDKAEINIQNEEKFVFSITYRNPKDFELDNGEGQHQVGTKSGLSWEQVGTKLGLSREQVGQLLSICTTNRSMSELSNLLNFSNKSKFKNKYINPLLNEGLLAMTVPDKPNSPLQKYYTTEEGKSLICPEENNKK